MEGLRRRIFNFAAEYNERGSFFSDLAAAEIERMLIMKFLLSHRHNYTHLLMREPPPVSSTAVRAVEEFIEANWDKPIDIEAMVAIAQVSARSLFRQFKKTAAIHRQTLQSEFGSATRGKCWSNRETAPR